MIKINWAVQGTGGRSIEIPFIKNKLSEVHSKKIADFGCLNGNSNKAHVNFSTIEYHIDNSNIIYYYDLADIPHLKDKYNRVDLMTENFCSETFDVGICVSVLEHIGLTEYGNTLNPSGDIIALKNMFKTIKTDGVLYVTVPSSEKDYMVNSWIRSYSPQTIISWEKILGCKIQINLFKKIGPDWYNCPVNEFKDVKHYSPPTTDINGVACIEFFKP